MSTLTTSPWQAAVDRISGKTAVGSRLRSADWARMPIALREASLFSAGVENVRIVSTMRDKLTQAAQQLRSEGTLMNKARFVADMRNMLGAAPGDSRALADITSRRRLELIWDFQQQDAHGFASRKADLDPDVQDAFPAYRLIRIEARRMPRDWLLRWAAAGSAVNWQGASRTAMVALVTSPIWVKLSRFGRPWPPFDYGSGMGLDAVDRDEAEKLRLLPKGEDPAARRQRLREGTAEAQRDWAENLRASVKDLNAQTRDWLRDVFGDQIVFDGDIVRWRGGAGTPTVRTATTAPIPPPEPTPSPAVLPDVDRVANAVAKAATREEAHAIVALPQAERGSLRINATTNAQAQADKAHDFIRSMLHRDVAPTATVKVELGHARANYHIKTATVTARQGSIESTIHEIAHHIECSDPEILAECRAFLKSRTKPGEIPQSLRKLTGNPGYSAFELAIEDEWAARGGTPYAGKVYPDGIGATEILTIGLERMYGNPVLFARQDPDYFKFILRVLRPTT